MCFMFQVKNFDFYMNMHDGVSAKNHMQWLKLKPGWGNKKFHHKEDYSQSTLANADVTLNLVIVYVTGFVELQGWSSEFGEP